MGEAYKPSREKAMRNLERSHYVRAQRKVLREKMKSGEVDGWAWLAGNEEEWEPIIARMRLDKALLLIPGIGEITLAEIMLELRLRPFWKLEQLTWERRKEIAQVVRGALEGDGTVG